MKRILFASIAIGLGFIVNEAFALDGFGLYGSKGAGGKHLSNANLDACHGHVENVVWDGRVRKMYHYHLTDEYPYTLGCFAGKPVRSARMNGQNQPAGQRPKNGNGGPEAMLEMAAAELGISVSRLRAALGSPPPNFRKAAKKLGISSQKLRRAMDRARRAQK